MSDLTEAFINATKGKPFNEKMFVPVFKWLSGYEKNIDAFQRINSRFFNVNQKILISEVALHNMCRHFIKYPKVIKDDEKLEFFYNDICSYYNWTRNELRKNFNVLNIDELSEEIAKMYAYDNKQRKLLNLEGLQYGKARKKNSVPTKKGTHNN